MAQLQNRDHHADNPESIPSLHCRYDDLRLACVSVRVGVVQFKAYPKILKPMSPVHLHTAVLGCVLGTVFVWSRFFHSLISVGICVSSHTTVRLCCRRRL